MRSEFDGEEEEELAAAEADRVEALESLDETALEGNGVSLSVHARPSASANS